jgi:hypothetical protein
MDTLAPQIRLIASSRKWRAGLPKKGSRMPTRYLDPKRYSAGHPVAADADADWSGNNAAFTCPVCSKVFIVGSFNNVGRLGLDCSGCGRSTAYVTGSAVSGGEAKIEWEF